MNDAGLEAKSPFTIGVLVSGRGSNLQAIIDACARGELDVRVGVVISNRADAYALERASLAEIPSRVLEVRALGGRAQQEKALIGCLEEHRVDLVVLAGYDRILGPAMLEAYRGRIINIHPSLLPSFGGGLHAQRDAFEYGVKVSGCTVHFVTGDLDAGPIILQAAVPVCDDDTADSLAARILEQEHKILPQAIALIASGTLVVEGRKVRRVLAEARSPRA